MRVFELGRSAAGQLAPRGGRLTYDAPSGLSPDPFARLRERKVAHLEHAAAVVAKLRSSYRQPIKPFEDIAIGGSLVIGVKVTPVINLKHARLTHDPRHVDGITNIAGYAGRLAEALSDA